MTDKPDYTAPVDGSRPLVKPARGPFLALLWCGLLALGAAVVFALIGWGAGDPLVGIVRLGTAGQLFGWSLPLLAGAAVIAALGRRQGDK